VRLGDSATGFGVGIDRDIVTASFQALLSAINRHAKHGVESDPQTIESETAPA